MSIAHIDLHGVVLLMAMSIACTPTSERTERSDGSTQAIDQELARLDMVSNQIVANGITHSGVIEAMSTVPRHEFVAPIYRSVAYEDGPLPIGEGQTISQPFIVALMTELIDPEPGDRILEVGTGSGYQAAVAAELVEQVHSIELIPELATSAAERLQRLGVTNVTVRAGDGYLGWPDEAPFDAILVTAGADHIPQPLLDQLAVGARMVIPVGPSNLNQVLKVIERMPNGEFEVQDILPVRFVPLRRG